MRVWKGVRMRTRRDVRHTVSFKEIDIFFMEDSCMLERRSYSMISTSS